jgi:hypothetical protein
MVGMMMVAVMVVPGFGGSLGNTAPDQESCGEDGDRRTRLGYVSQRQVLSIQHILVPQDSIATYVTSGTPVPFEWLPFGGLMRHKLGSNFDLSRAVITCYRMHIIHEGSVIIGFNNLLTIDYLEILTNEVVAGLDEFNASNAQREIAASPRRSRKLGMGPCI